MPPFTTRFVTAADGLRLHARDYGEAGSARSVLCLPGVGRSVVDFEPLVEALLAGDPGRRIVALDYRGRGGSDWDPDPARYAVPVEAADIQGAIEALGVGPSVVVGTSRGGIHAMALAIARPDVLRGAVLNDIGPVLEVAGLERIKGYLGKLPAPRSWAEAVAIVRGIAGAQFTGLDEAGWLHYARTTYEERSEGFRVRYDPAVMQGFATLDPARLPSMWEAFDALAPVPLMVIRGANSDLLSTETVRAMAARHPDCVTLTVAGQGHAPLLADASTMQAIDSFVSRCHAMPV